MTENPQEILTFTVEKQRFAIHLHAVDRAIRAVAVTKLTNSPNFMEGVIDYYGEIIAVINMKKRMGYPLQELKLSDRLIIVKTTKRKVALIVDEVEDVIVPDNQDLYKSIVLNAGLNLLSLLRADQGIILIYDLESLLSETEEIKVKEIIKAQFPTDGKI